MKENFLDGMRKQQKENEQRGVEKMKKMSDPFEEENEKLRKELPLEINYLKNTIKTSESLVVAEQSYLEFAKKNYETTKNDYDKEQVQKIWDRIKEYQKRLDEKKDELAKLRVRLETVGGMEIPERGTNPGAYAEREILTAEQHEKEKQKELTELRKRIAELENPRS